MLRRLYVHCFRLLMLFTTLLITACNNSPPQPTVLPQPTSAGTRPTSVTATTVPPTPAVATTVPRPTVVPPTAVPPTATPIAQSLAIDTPPPQTLVGSPVVLTGRMARTPFSGQLTYRLDNEAGQQIGGGSFAASGTAFNASLNFTLPSQGGAVRATISDAAEANATLDLFVAAAQQVITIDSPPPGTQVGSPVVITGRLARSPFQNNLAYRFRNLVDGRTLGEGILNVPGAVGRPANFSASLNFLLPPEGGTVRLELFDQDASNNFLAASAALDLRVAAQAQAIIIQTPPSGIQIGSPVVITGRTVRYPYGGNLNYRVSDGSGNQLAFGAFSVTGTPGYGTTFNQAIVFNLPPQGGMVRFDFFDQNAQTGVVVASATIDLRVSPPAPVQQVVTIDSPLPGTQVGSPVVITGRTTRFPSQGVLGYRVYDAQNSQIGGGTFAVNGSAGQPASFTASLSFTPPNGGIIRVDVFDQDAASGAIVGGTSLNLNIASLPQPLAAITGLLTTLDQSALPSDPGTVITLRLLDVSRQDAALLIAETQVPPSPRIPLPFELRYNPAQINAANRYVVSAEVRVNGLLTHRTNAQYTVITQGNPTNIVLLLERV